MENHYRDYIRTSNWNIHAKISADKKQWFDVQVPNISANGLLFLTDRSYEKDDTVWFDLKIAPMAIGPDFKVNINVKAIVQSDRGTQDNMRIFSVKFTEISDSDTIQLDELVRLTVSKYGNY